MTAMMNIKQILIKMPKKIEVPCLVAERRSSGTGGGGRGQPTFTSGRKFRNSYTYANI
jgi:hypothetical protein